VESGTIDHLKARSYEVTSFTVLLHTFK